MSDFSSEEYDEDYLGGNSDTDDNVDSDKSEKSDEEEIDDDDGEEVSHIPTSHSEIVNIVAPENRRTSLIMSSLEMAEHNSIRATQIEEFGNCFVDVSDLSDPIEMAQREIMQRKSPLKVRRFVGVMKNSKTGLMEKYYEEFSPNEMQFATVYRNVLW